MEDNDWAWHFITLQGLQAICNICDKDFFPSSPPRSRMQTHLENKHKESITGKDIISLCTLQNDRGTQKIKCNFCPKTYKHISYMGSHMREHLEKYHELNKDKADLLQAWLENYFFTSSSDNNLLKCNKCYDEFPGNNYVVLTNHLFSAQQVDTPQRFLSKKK